MLNTGSRWHPLPSGTGAPTHQQSKESIQSHLSLLLSGTTCLLSLTKTVQLLECFQDLLSWSCWSGLLPALLCLSSHMSASGNSTLLQLPGVKHTLIKPCVGTTLELNQKLSLRLEVKGCRLECVFSRIRKSWKHLFMVREISGISQKSSSYF